MSDLLEIDEDARNAHNGAEFAETVCSLTNDIFCSFTGAVRYPDSAAIFSDRAPSFYQRHRDKPRAQRDHDIGLYLRSLEELGKASIILGSHLKSCHRSGKVKSRVERISEIKRATEGLFVHHAARHPPEYAERLAEVRSNIQSTTLDARSDAWACEILFREFQMREEEIAAESRASAHLVLKKFREMAGLESDAVSGPPLPLALLCQTSQGDRNWLWARPAV